MIHHSVQFSRSVLSTFLWLGKNKFISLWNTSAQPLQWLVKKERKKLYTKYWQRCERTEYSTLLSLFTQFCLTLCDPMDCSTSGFPVHHQFPELAQTHVQWVNDDIQSSHPLLFPSPAFNLYQNQGLFQWVSFLYQVDKLLKFQLQHQSFQWILMADFL